MPSLGMLVILLALVRLGQALALPPQDRSSALPSMVKRTAAGPTFAELAPAPVTCPALRPTIRKPTSLSPQEQAWLAVRRQNTIDPLRQFLSRVGIAKFDAGAYIDAHRGHVSALPNIAVAISGGGYRSMLTGAGAIAAFDSRTPGATGAGRLGGLLQASSYVAGLSGGSWLVGSLFLNNFPTIAGLQAGGAGGTLWDLGRTVLEGPRKPGANGVNVVNYITALIQAVRSKDAAGFRTSITDYWGRALSYQLIDGANGGAGVEWSSIADAPSFRSASTPMPIVIADGRAPGEVDVPTNTTIFEFTPWEMGSWDATTFGFAPLRYLGSRFDNGVLAPGAPCVRGFDDAGFIMGTSSSIFNAILTRLDNINAPQLLKDAAATILRTMSMSDSDIADYNPNPFFHWDAGPNLSADSEQLTLVDGGEDGQGLPLHPLIQPARAVDVIFAVDSSSDAHQWPDGTSLIATYQRTRHPIGPPIPFPDIPDRNTFVNLGLNNRPTFFGCSSAGSATAAATATAAAAAIPPLVVYLPNAPYSFASNTSTFQLAYATAERDAMIQNGYEMATQAHAALDPLWPTCVACAVLQRSLVRTGTPRPAACQSCFQRYCWDGTRRAQPAAPYLPAFKMAPA
ncbi:MAG: Lysophospholipase 1 [Phylliscum demangeonii]|nr:MAG: Lysophospholipase 1 [Phylliscum demangeonii]